MDLAVANQYAKALMEVVSKPGSALGAEAALEQLQTVSATLQDSRDLRELMMTPAIDRVRKRKALNRIGDVLGLHPLLTSFLNVVTHHRRANIFHAIADSFRTQLDEQRGVVRAVVSAARELTPAQRDSLEASLRERTGKQVLCDYSVNPILVGGLIVKIGSTMFDGSVQGQLEGLRRRLASQA